MAKKVFAVGAKVRTEGSTRVLEVVDYRPESGIYTLVDPRNNVPGDYTAYNYYSNELEEVTMEAKKYRVLKRVDLAAFISAHKEDYGWNYMVDACRRFNEDVESWAIDFKPTLAQNIGEELPVYSSQFSSDFYPHLVKYGFVEEVKEPKLYKRGDMFECPNWDGSSTWTLLLARAEDKRMVLIVMNEGRDKGNSWSDPVECADHLEVTEEELKKMYGMSSDFHELKKKEV